LHPEVLRKLLDDVARGQLGVDIAVTRLASLPFEDLGFAKLDHHRALRCGVPETIFAQGKTDQQVEAIFERLAAAGDTVLATRVAPSAAERLSKRWPLARHNALARTITLAPRPVPENSSAFVGVLCAGTADLPVAEEARETLHACGVRSEAFQDIGVAGLHRTLSAAPRFRAAAALIVVAGMEGALPSVVGGLVDCPIIAVPTSIGYGASFAGLAALLAMLNSCAAGVTVVNIDNGYGAAIHAVRIARLAERSEKPAT
jgi:NCAIR mutase (PurE)-related protein